jgi:hypothetical protein
MFFAGDDSRHPARRVLRHAVLAGSRVARSCLKPSALEFTVLALALALLSAAPASAQSRYRIVCHFECGAAAEQALRAADAAWPLARVLFDAEPPALDAPLEIHLYRTAADYRAARRGLLRSPPRSLATTDPRTRTAHIALRGAIADTTLRRFGLPANVLRVVAHEAFHLATLAHSPRAAGLPSWLAEGAASWAEHEALRALGIIESADDEPVAATYLWLLQRRAHAGTLPRAAAILDDDLRRLDEQERYAVRKLLFAALLAVPAGERLPAQLDTLLADARRGRLAGALRARIAPDSAALAELDARMHAALAAARPVWALATRSLDALPAGGLLQIGLDGDAEAWRHRFAAMARVVGSVEALAPGVARVLIGTNEAGHVVVAIDAAADRLSVRRVRDDGSSPSPLGVAALGTADGPIEFRVEATAGRLTVAAGRARIELEPQNFTPNGRWGVGAAAGANLVWHVRDGLP